MKIPASFFKQGIFYVDLMITNGKEQLSLRNDAIAFAVLHDSVKLGNWMGKSPGSLKSKISWNEF